MTLFQLLFCATGMCFQNFQESEKGGIFKKKKMVFFKVLKAPGILLIPILKSKLVIANEKTVCQTGDAGLKFSLK